MFYGLHNMSLPFICESPYALVVYLFVCFHLLSILFFVCIFLLTYFCILFVCNRGSTYCGTRRKLGLMRRYNGVVSKGYNANMAEEETAEVTWHGLLCPWLRHLGLKAEQKERVSL